MDPSDVMRMGVGGLLKDIPSRPMPRSRQRGGGDDETAPARRPNIAAIVWQVVNHGVWAENKLLAEIDGKPMVRHVVDAVSASSVASTTVVVGHEADQVRAALSGTGVDFAVNPAFDDGLSTSLKAGIAAVGTEVDGVVVCLGDMPKLTTDLIDRIIAAFDPLEGRAIVVPTHRGKRGNPVLFAAKFFDEIAEIAGDVGARHLIGQHEDLLVELPCDDDAILLDIDTPEMLRAVTQDRSQTGAPQTGTGAE